MTDALDVDLIHRESLAELELTVAAGESTEPLAQDEIDGLLGVETDSRERSSKAP